MALIVGIEENCLAQKVSIMEGGGLHNHVTGGCLYHTYRPGWMWGTSWMSCVESQS